MEDLSLTDKEKAYIAELLAKYPAEQRRLFDDQDGIECVYLGEGEISPKLTNSIIEAKAILRNKFKNNFGAVFQGLKIYYGRNIRDMRGNQIGGGKAYSGANAITMDIDNNCLTIAQAEEMLGPEGAGFLDEGDWQRVVADREGPQTISGETTLIHEIGHIFQAKTNTKFKDTKNAPTKYGRTEEWEDYAESFLYYCYNKPLAGNRTAEIIHNIETATAG